MVETLNEKEKIFFERHGLVILKPDAIGLFLENYFIQDLEKLNLLVKYRQLLQLKVEDIPFLYPEWVSNKEKFAAITDNMTEGLCMLLLLEAQHIHQEKDLHFYIKKIKGRADEPGLRNRYIHIFEEELKQRYPKPEQFLRELNKNRIHSPENGLEALSTIIYFWPRLDKEVISRTLPDLYDIMAFRLGVYRYGLT